MIHALRSVLAIAVLVIFAAAAVAGDRPRIVTVNYPLQYFAERLAGDAAEVTFPVPNGVDPSFWRPSVADISAIQSADLILLNGAGFATWIDRVSLPRSKIVNTTAALQDRFITTESVTHSHGDGGEHTHDGFAAFTWLDPTLAIAQAEAVAAAIAGRDLAPPDAVYARLTELRSELEDLDAAAMAALAPARDIAMIATHPRYQYLARRYGLTIDALEWEAGAMPSAEELTTLETRASETGARVIIWEAEPPQAAKDAVTALGLESATFAPLAHRDGSADFAASFRAAVDALSESADPDAGG